MSKGLKAGSSNPATFCNAPMHFPEMKERKAEQCLGAPPKAVQPSMAHIPRHKFKPRCGLDILITSVTSFTTMSGENKNTASRAKETLLWMGGKVETLE